jgi:hypothetical protein
MTDLRELMYDASSAAGGPADLDAVVAEGQRRVRRRRLVGSGIAVAATASLVTALVLVAPRLSDSAPEPAKPEPVRLTTDDAIQLEPRVLHEQTVAVDRDGSTPLTYDGITSDGRVVLHRVVQSFAHQAGLLDPASGDITWYDPVPTRGGLGLGEPLLLDRTRLLFAQGPDEGRFFNVLTLDRASGTWRVTRVETTEADPYYFNWSPFLAADGRVWFRGGPNLRGDPAPVEWWSASTTESGPARLEEAAAPGLGSGHGRLLSRIDPNGQLVVRDLLDGNEWSASLGSGCTNGWATTAENRVLVSQLCPDGAQFVVFDAKGNPVLLISDGLVILDDKAVDGSVGVTMPARGSFYILDLEKLTLSEVASSGCQGHGFPSVAGGGLIAWCHDASPQVPVGEPADEVTYRVAELPVAD